MSFNDEMARYSQFDFDGYFSSVTDSKIRSILNKERINENDFLALLSPKASSFIEEMARKAQDITKRQFGNVIFLFTPLYISNICENVCSYCSFARQHKISRRHLTVDQIKKEGIAIKNLGIRHILILTGESRKVAGSEYLIKSVNALRDLFSSIAIEIYPMSGDEYGEMIESGVDGLTIYQETYDKILYEKLHRGGPKEDYLFRLNAPERACKEGMRSITLGPLLGLGEPRKEVFFSALHVSYLQNRYPWIETSISFPRIRPLAADFEPNFVVGDRSFVQFMTASRIFLQSTGITISTRESAEFRNAILPMGPTKMSAGVSTSVGTQSESPSESQFEIADKRSVQEMKKDLISMGYQPVMHDWNHSYTR
ncbi:2-iminoacetate synthase ThiH [Chitinispirillales bacterium ANBcel5]|uniref:2-iminoacetate synthase ThiH n=1 Tax=Cellulosispirillum alkaliphilum TaxID=3039283 RepID=UPI002A517B0E|nr:2-iminoacetate synthase ThiH [Chitinispirillales bacterium ANBcel5]